MKASLPTADDAAQIAQDLFGEQVRLCNRFPTGLRHWVYDIELETNQRVVVRMSDPDNRAELAGAVYWTQRLVDMHVPVAAVLHHDVHCAKPYMVLERLAGDDLGNVFDQLSDTQLSDIAAQVAAMQHQTAGLPHGSGFGYALDYTQLLERTWLDVVTDQVERAERSIRSAGVVDATLALPVRRQVAEHQDTLLAIEPRAFLHDATTKNVIVHHGRLSGLVDVDTMAFGDPLWAVALTRMSLLAAGRSTAYADTLAAAMGISPGSAELLDLYTSVFCLDFLGELGQTFNQTKAPPIDPALQHRLETVLHAL